MIKLTIYNKFTDEYFTEYYPDDTKLNERLYELEKYNGTYIETYLDKVDKSAISTIPYTSKPICTKCKVGPIVEDRCIVCTSKEG